jgi:protocatechuate 3,4-dioxygenase beta subunit
MPPKISKRLRNLTIIAVACVFVAPRHGLFAQQSTPIGSADESKKLCTVGGSVVRSGTNEALSKARVMLRSEDDNSASPHVTVTNAEGHFTLEDIPPGRYKVRVERNGYVGKSYGEDDQGNSSTVLTLKPAQQLTDLIFRLQRCGVISGRILDEDGEAAEKVTVELLAQNTRRGKMSTYMVGSAETNDLGEYRLFDLWPGRYLVRAYPRAGSGEIIGGTLVESSTLTSAGGYAPTYFPNALESSRASAIELKSGEEVSGIDLTLLRQKTFKVRGRVFNAVADRLSGHTMVAILPDDPTGSSYGDIRRGSIKESTGDFEINDVPAGRYIVFAEWREGENHLEGSVPVEVSTATVDSVRIVINRGADVHGRVIIEGKVAPASEVNISIESRNPRQLGFNGRAQMKPDGTFLLTGLSDGVYDFEAWSQCDGCYLKAATANSQDILDGGLQISSGTYPSPIVLVYSSNSATVDGTVVRDDGLPASGAEVILIPDRQRSRSSRDYREKTTDQYGHFTVRGIAPGNYHVYSFQGADIDYSDPESLKPFEQKAQALSIGENEKKSIQLSVLSPSNDHQ